MNQSPGLEREESSFPTRRRWSRSRASLLWRFRRAFCWEAPHRAVAEDGGSSLPALVLPFAIAPASFEWVVGVVVSMMDRG